MAHPAANAHNTITRETWSVTRKNRTGTVGEDVVFLRLTNNASR